ncbi:MAG: hypothetical protein U0175_18090 [Caldilineaceae bacterium]
MRRFNYFAGSWLRSLFTALLCALMVMTPASVYAAAGDLDPTFGDGGKVVIDFGREDSAMAVVRQLDGKIVATGTAYTSNDRDVLLVRYNPNGSLDTTFDGDGKVITNFSDEAATDLLLQPDGKIVITGMCEWNILLVRYNTNGSLDTSFGNGGRVVTDYGGSDNAYAVILQPDGKLVVAGWGASGSSVDFALVRYNPDGTLDTSFDGDGKVLTDLPGTSLAMDLLLQPDGKFVAAGGAGWWNETATGRDIALVRYNADGSLDSSFDGDGKLLTDFGSNEYITGLMLQPDGKLVGTGTANGGDFLVIRYNSDGSLDTTFSSDGKDIVDLGGYEQGNAVVYQANGKVVVAGYGQPGGNFNYALMRYNTDGSLDPTFGSNGKVFTDFGYDQAFDLLLQPDGRFVVSGRMNDNFAVARYLGDSPALATIRIVQDAIPDNTRNYVYDSAFGSFRLDDTGTLPDDKDGVPNSMTFNVAPGSYGFSQQMVTGWRVSEIRCDHPELATVNISNRSVTLKVKQGDNITCTFVTKQAVTVYARSYWDKNASRFYDVNEPWKSGVWTEIFDSTGKSVAANFTDANGQVGAFNLAPGSYSVCQTAPSGWWNTQPAKLDPRYGKPCYSFNVAPAGLVTGYFGWINRPFVASAEDDMADRSGLDVTVFETPNEEESGSSMIYLPMIVQ